MVDGRGRAVMVVCPMRSSVIERCGQRSVGESREAIEAMSARIRDLVARSQGSGADA